MLRLIVAATIALLAAFFTVHSIADAPFPAPVETKFYSQNKRFLAVSDPVTWFTTVYELEPKTGHREKRWSMYGWFRGLWVDNGGEHLLVLSPNMGLIPLNYDKNNTAFFLVHKGSLVKAASVLDVVRKESNVARTASHYTWGTSLGVDEFGRFRVATPDGSIFFMDMPTGVTGVEAAVSKKDAP